MSLDQYVKNMHKKQEFIYFLAGQEREILLKSPLLQKLKERDIDVLLLDDPIDEFCVQNLVEFDKKKLKNVAKKDLKLWDEDEEFEKKKFDKIKKHYDILIKWWKNRLGKQVESIEISKRLVDNPCIIVASEHGYSANMQRISESQAFTNQDKSTNSYLYGKKYLEINPNHPAIKTLRQKIMESEKPDTYVEDTADLLFESALLESGYQLSDIHNFAAKMDRVLKYNLSLDRYATASELDIKVEDEEEVVAEEKPVEEAKTEEAKTEEASEVKIEDVVNTEKIEEVKHDDL
jgi:heat shock protein beta